MNYSRYKIIWVKQTNKWIVQDNDKDGIYKFMFSGNEEECKNYVKEKQREEKQVTLF